MMQSSASPMINKIYRLGKIGGLIVGENNTLSLDSLDKINSFSHRYTSLVIAYKEKRKELFGKFVKRYLKKEQSDHKKLFNDLNQCLEGFRNELDDYFSHLEAHCETLFSMMLEKLKLDTSDTEKTRSIVAMMIDEYKSEIGATLKVPRNSLGEMSSLPSSWTLEEDENLQQGKCTLQLTFGQVVGEFDASANALLALLSEKQTG
jgi:hypothetical protein